MNVEDPEGSAASEANGAPDLDQDEDRWEFDLENIPDALDYETIRHLKIGQLAQLEDADLSSQQRESFQAATHKMFGPAIEAARKAIAKQDNLRGDLLSTEYARLANTFGSFSAPASQRASQAAKLASSSFRSKIPNDLFDAKEIKPRPMIEVPNTTRLERTAQASLDHMVHENVEREERERQHIQHAAATVEVLTGLREIAIEQERDHRTDRRIQWAILIIAVLTLVATLFK